MLTLENPRHYQVDCEHPHYGAARYIIEIDPADWPEPDDPASAARRLGRYRFELARAVEDCDTDGIETTVTPCTELSECGDL